MGLVRLSELAALGGLAPDEAEIGIDPEISRATADSRSVGSGDLFVCMPSATRDTHAFIPEVKKAGASAVLVHSSSGLLYAKSLGIPALYCEPSGVRFNFVTGRLCRYVFGDPTGSMRITGVTGTNGKTTTAWIVRNALKALGRRAGYLGTLGFQTDGEISVLNNTTPFPVELWQLLSSARESGMEDLVMEVSSHALYERRLSGVQFDVGVFTNLSQDHLDFHGTMAEYSAAKKLFFTEYAALTDKPFVGVLNVDDPVGREWSRSLPCRVATYGTDSGELLVWASLVEVDGIVLEVSRGDVASSVTLKLGGGFNVANAGSALAALLALGYGLDESLSALSTVTAVPGRFEPVSNDAGIGVIVDYAHTPDAVEALLRSARSLGPGKIITVFGCGGDRDRSKRPLMARAASEGSDVVVMTSDNPRTEDPEMILDDVEVGLVPGVESYRVLDRREAIALAVGLAKAGDLVVIAGKGHEDYQIIGRTKHPMDDRAIAREALAGR